MSHHPTTFAGDIHQAIRTAVQTRLPDAQIEVTGGGGHWSIVVTSAAFAGKSVIESHRMVLQGVAPLMAGEGAPVHAIDKLETKVP